ncbi:hypothetical protein F4775DRAFT_589403 [Biscogniauxia sp. FL1348]|nr:hypothetical protein F4775DRAFT_589403 [Biscogniauxia sp. FL1348]
MSHPQTVFTQTTFPSSFSSSSPTTTTTTTSLLRSRRDTIRRATLRAQLARMKRSGQYYCFNLQWQPAYDGFLRDYWPAPPAAYWDSDVAKWIEGACYFLSSSGGGEDGIGDGEGDGEGEIDAAVRELTDMIRGAQQSDGYLNVYFTVLRPGERWTNLRDLHELYNAGHLIEAALAHKKHYKNDLLMEPIQKYVKLIHSTFGPGENQKHGYPGHPEIELALLRLYTVTGNQDAYDLAKYFIEERGNPKGQDGMHYYDWERQQRGDSPWKRPDSYPQHINHWYNQAHQPILEQKSIEGHAVRALYLYTGVADLACHDALGLRPFGAKAAYLDAVRGLWDNMVGRKMYLTGGVGAMWQWEGFGIDYFLPQGSDDGGCYNETCASIAVVMLAERLLHLDLDAKYADVMELCLYNNIMTAMSLEGNAFTYVNQLASSESAKSVREEWFATSCCPPNLTRFFGSIGGYLWDYGGGAENDVFVHVHLYTTARVEFEADPGRVVFEQRSNWPWDGRVEFTLQAPADANTTLRLRIPGWAEGRFKLNPAPDDSSSDLTVEKGYLLLPPSYTAAHRAFALEVLGFAPRFVAPHPRTGQRLAALARGPLVYCVEDADHPWESDHFRDVGVETDAHAIREEERTCGATDERYVALRAEGWVRRVRDGGGPGVGVGELEDGDCERRQLILAANGAKVYITGRRTEVLEKSARIHSDAERLGSSGGSIVPLVMDVTSKESIKAVVDEISAKETHVNVLVNNAGVYTLCPEYLPDNGPEKYAEALFAVDIVDIWQNLYMTNYVSIYYATAASIPLLSKAAASTPMALGNVINVLSKDALQKTTGNGNYPYGVSKAASLHLTKTMAYELRKDSLNIRVNAIAPGPTPSGMTCQGKVDDKNTGFV